MDFDHALTSAAHLGRFSGLATTVAGFLAGSNPTLYMAGGVLMASGIGLEAAYHVYEGEVLA